MEHLRKALSIFGELSASDPSNRTLRAKLASIHHVMGSTLGVAGAPNLGDTRGALEHHRQALAIDEALLAEEPSNAKYGQHLATAYDNVGRLLFTNGNLTEALEHYRKALAIGEALSREDGSNALYRRELAVQHRNVASALLATGDQVRALEHSRQAVKLFEALIATDPDDASIRRSSAYGYRDLGEALAANHDRAGALENFHRASRIFAELAARDPKNAILAHQQSLTHLKTSRFLSDTGRLAAAADNARQAIRISEAMAAGDPKNSSAHGILALSCLQLGQCQTLIASQVGIPVSKQAEHWREARAWYQRALDISQDLQARGALSTSDAQKLGAAAGEIARCDASLARLRAEAGQKTGRREQAHTPGSSLRP